MIYNKLVNELPESRIIEIITNAVEIENAGGPYWYERDSHVPIH